MAEELLQTPAVTGLQGAFLAFLYIFRWLNLLLSTHGATVLRTGKRKPGEKCGLEVYGSSALLDVFISCVFCLHV